MNAYDVAPKPSAYAVTTRPCDTLKVVDVRRGSEWWCLTFDMVTGVLNESVKLGTEGETSPPLAVQHCAWKAARGPLHRAA